MSDDNEGGVREGAGRREAALEGVLEEIRDADLRRQAELGAFRWEDLGEGIQRLVIPSFGESIEILMPGGEIRVPSRIDSFSLRVLALRYVKLSCGLPETGEWIAYRDLPGGRFYATTLVPTVEEPLARIFGFRRGLLGEAAMHLGGARAEYGDESFVFRAFPRVPLLLVLHWGDDEFPPQCRVLFDRCCPRYLNTDDLKVLATQLAAYLMRWAGEESEIDNLLWMVE
jgi:hypothetical protein